MNIKYNEFASTMLDNRQVMSQLEADEMTRNEWKKYLKICDTIATEAYAYINGGDFEPFRSSIHALFSFVETDTNILGIDGYSVRFLPAIVAYKQVKSKVYKEAEKKVRLCKKAIEWARIESKVDGDDPEAVLFPAIVSMEDYEKMYFYKDIQEYYNALVPVVKSCVEEGVDVQLKHVTEHLEKLEAERDALAQIPGNFYKDFKDPMKSPQGKALKHAPMSIRKGIEDTLADILTARSMMTEEQIAKEEAQIKGGKKEVKKMQRAEAESEAK